MNKIINTINDILDKFDPIRYANNRNFVNGNVSKLSPYISRGVISTRYIYDYLVNIKGYKLNDIEKFVQELLWRDYFQRVWQHNPNLFSDFFSKQEKVSNYSIPLNIINVNTEISAIDNAILSLYQNNYLHNHLRMYLSSIICNVGQCHWLIPAKWMYYHLLDADWASNSLSWQWVAGTFSSKKYFANQENINKYTFSKDQKTFLDCSYEEIVNMPIPFQLKELHNLELKTNLPQNTIIKINNELPTCVYNFYNLDPLWRNDLESNRILLLEPSFFEIYPSSQNVIDFIIELSKNIDNIQIFVGEFNELQKIVNNKIYYKEHPTNKHYIGNEDDRDWIIKEDTKFYKSFSKYWYSVKKYLN